MDRAIAALARQQHGVIATRQLAELGLTLPDGVDAVVDAVQSAGAETVRDRLPTLGRIPRDCFVVFGPPPSTTRERIAVTTPARTILDLAATLSRSRLEDLLDCVEIRELTDHPALDAIARAHPGHRGATKLRRTLATHHAGEDLSRSDLEIVLKQLCRDDDLPQPRVNQPVAGRTVDFLFAEQRLIVETDSWRYHKTPTRAGYRTLRFTDRQLTRQPEHVAHAIAAVLADRRAA